MLTILMMTIAGSCLGVIYAAAQTPRTRPVLVVASIGLTLLSAVALTLTDPNNYLAGALFTIAVLTGRSCYGAVLWRRHCRTWHADWDGTATSTPSSRPTSATCTVPGIRAWPPLKRPSSVKGSPTAAPTRSRGRKALHHRGPHPDISTIISVPVSGRDSYILSVLGRMGQVRRYDLIGRNLEHAANQDARQPWARPRSSMTLRRRAPPAGGGTPLRACGYWEV